MPIESDESDWIGNNVWKEVEGEKVKHSAPVEGYKSNMEWVLDKIEQDLIEDLEGKVVITSDHGNLLGENGFYGHDPGGRSRPLRKVPWDVR